MKKSSYAYTYKMAGLTMSVAMTGTLLLSQAFAGGKDYDTDRYVPPTEKNESAKEATKGTTKDSKNSVKGDGSGGMSVLKGVPQSENVLKQVFDLATQKLEQAEVLLKSGQYSEALTVSKSSLDEVRQKAGIHPKAQFRDKIDVDVVIKDSMRSSQTSYENLSLRDRDIIAQKMGSFKEGYYLDTLNLMKRTNLIYIQAFIKTLQDSESKSGRKALLKRDIEKIKSDIREISLIPIYIREPGTGRLFLIFDYEVASSDQNYLFNRELFKFILDSKDIFQIDSEDKADEFLKTYENEVRIQFWKGQ